MSYDNYPPVIPLKEVSLIVKSIHIVVGGGTPTTGKNSTMNFVYTTDIAGILTAA